MADHEAPSDDPRRPFGQPVAPFDEADLAHKIMDALKGSEYRVADSPAFLRRLQHVEYGLSAEVEFSAIIAWLGRCVLVHRLDQDAYTSDQGVKWRIPDLFAVFEHLGEQVPVLVEVKTTPYFELKFRPDYLDELRDYARLLGHPLLVAWRPRPFGQWLLIDPDIARQDGTRLVVDFSEAAKNNLMSSVAGEFIVQPKAGIGLFFELEPLDVARVDETTIEGKFRIADAGFWDAAHKKADDVPPGIIATIFASNRERTECKPDGRILQSFAFEGEPVWAQAILRAAVGYRLKEGQRIHWRNVARGLERILSRATLYETLNANFGRFIRYVFHQMPHVWPDFVPQSWRESMA